MARVPQYSQQVGGSVQFQAPGVTPVQDQTGAQLQQAGQGLMTSGIGIQRLGDAIELSNDTARITEADSQLSDYLRERLNPVSGYRSKLGKSAVDDYKIVSTEIESKRKEIAGILQTPRQREQFDRVAQQRLRQAQDAIDGHAAHQTSIYEVSQQSAAVEAHKADYLNGLGDPEAMATSLGLMERSVNAIADTAGASPEARQKMLTDARTGLHGSMVEQLLDSGNIKAAGEYLSAKEKSIDPTVRAKLGAQVKRMSANQDASDLAKHIMDNAPKSGSVSERRLYAIESAAATAAGKGMSAEDSARLVAQLDKQLDQELDVYTTRHNVEVERAAEWFSANPNARLDDYPRTEELDAAGGGAKVRKWLMEGREPKTTPDAWLSLQLLNEGASIPDGPLRGRRMQDLSAEQFEMLFSRSLSESDYKTALSYYAKSIGKAAREDWSLIKSDELIERTIAEMGVDVVAAKRMIATEAADAATDENVLRYDVARTNVQNALSASGLRDGDDPAKIRAVLDRVKLDKVSRSLFGFDDQISAATVIPSDKPYVTVMFEGESQEVNPFKIPKGIRAEIMGALASEGMPISEQAIAQHWVNQKSPANEEQYRRGRVAVSQESIEDAYQQMKDKASSILSIYAINKNAKVIFELMPDGLSVEEKNQLLKMVMERNGR